MTKIIVDALRKTNQRGLINEGWGGMGKSTTLSLFQIHFYDHDSSVYDVLFHMSFDNRR